MRFLRTNTAVIVTVGPFYDKTDGVTIEGSLTITNERITLTADTDAGSAPTNILDNVTGATSGTANDLNYISGNDAGMMQLELAAADTNRLGRMFLSITDAANHVPVFHEFMVLPAMIYDAFILGTDVLQADMTQILGTAVSSPATAGVLDANVKNINNVAAATPGAAGGVFIAGTNAATTVTTALTTTFTGNLTGSVGSVTGAVGSVTGAVGSVTGAVGSVTGNVGGNVTGSVGSVVADVDSNLVSVNGDTGPADRLERAANTEVLVTVDTGSSTTSVVTSSMAPAAAVTDQFKGRILLFDKDTTTANLRGQATDITASTSGGVLTVTALTNAPVSGDTAVIV